MDIRMAFGEQDKIPVTLTMTMTLGEWKQLDKQLHDAWPASRLSAHISRMVSKAITIVWGESSDDGSN